MSTTTKKQMIWCAAIIGAGMLAAVALLYEPFGHGDEDGHGHGEPTTESAERGNAPPEEHGAEGLIKLDAERAAANGITTGTAGPAQIATTTAFPGEVRFNADRLAHVVPRMPGIVNSVSADLGQTVRSGQVLAIIASTTLSDLRSELFGAQRRAELANQTYQREERLWRERVSAEQEFLQAKAAREEADIAVQNARQKLAAVGAPPTSSGLNQYALRAPFDGVVIAKHMTLGESVNETDQAFTIADLRTVWAEFIVAPKDLPIVTVGAKVRISTSAFQQTTQGTVAYVGQLIGDQTRTATARVNLENADELWRPGLFITVQVLGQPESLKVAVPASAIQTVDGAPTVFRVTPDGFQAQAVKVGRTDGQTTEIIEGLEAGAQYATANTFVLKAELGKSEAEHAH